MESVRLRRSETVDGSEGVAGTEVNAAAAAGTAAADVGTDATATEPGLGTKLGNKFMEELHKIPRKIASL